MSVPKTSFVVKTPDRINYEHILTYQCQPTLTCPRLVAIYEHMEKFYDGHPYSTADFKNAKKTFTEEFWRHAPVELNHWKKKVLEDPINHKSLSRYEILLKMYKYQLQNPLYRFPDTFENRLEEHKRICANVTEGSWGNFE